MKSSYLTLFPLTMLIIGSIDSVRNLAASALFGTSLIFFMLLSALLFLIPTALVSAELAAQDSANGGIYYWVKKAFGKNLAMLSIWLQWINTMIWFPTILSFIAGTAAYLIDPKLVENQWYLVAVILLIFWALTLMSLKGIKVSAVFAAWCGILGVGVPMILIIILALVWIIQGQPQQIHFHTQNLIPQFTHGNSWVSLTAIMTAFLGIELATVHVKDIHDPKRTFPKALVFAVIAIVSTMLLASLAIAIVIPAGEINLIAGVIETFRRFFHAYHSEYLLGVMVLLILIGSIGSMVNWVVSPAKGLLQAAQDGFLPAQLQKINKHGVPTNLLLLQAILVSILACAFLLMPSVNGSYWLLTDLSTQLYMIMYVFMFIAAMKLARNKNKHTNYFTIPGGARGTRFVANVGITGCLITLFVGFIPPQHVEVGGDFHYILLLGSAIFVAIMPVISFYRYRNRQNNTFKAIESV